MYTFFGNKNGSLTGMSAFMSELNVDLLIYFSYMLQTHRVFASWLTPGKHILTDCSDRSWNGELLQQDNNKRINFN